MIKNKHEYITSFEAAAIIGVSPAYIRELICQGKIKAEKFGHNWIIRKSAISHVKRQRHSRKKDLTNGRNKQQFNACRKSVAVSKGNVKINRFA
jgi:excisionase family DNA binding protein